MWDMPDLTERIAQDRVRDWLREADHQRLIREARSARGARGVQGQNCRGLAIVHRFLAGKWHAADVIRHFVPKSHSAG
jgi:hypothetical protein